MTDDGDTVVINDTENKWSDAVSTDNADGTHSFKYTATDNSGDSITLKVDDQIDTSGM